MNNGGKKAASGWAVWLLAAYLVACVAVAYLRTH